VWWLVGLGHLFSFQQCHFDGGLLRRQMLLFVLFGSVLLERVYF
jgi:hypothetical protein